MKEPTNEWKVCDELWRPKAYSNIFSDTDIAGEDFGRVSCFGVLLSAKWKIMEVNPPPCLRAAPWLSVLGQGLRVSRRRVGVWTSLLPTVWELTPLLQSPLSVLRSGDSRRSPTWASFVISSYFVPFHLFFCFFSFTPVIGFPDT